MDSTFSRSPFSPRARPSISTKRSSLLPSLKKSSRYSVSGRSTQSVQIIAKTPYHILETFGSPLPVLITEALTFADRNTTVSAQISNNGYAWVVCGRRLLIWQYKSQVRSVGSTGITPQCYELNLPPSDLVHRAELVAIALSETQGSPSCLAVSPEGVVRYWPSVSHEGVSVEQNLSLNGQECASVAYVPSVGYVLATTTCSVVLVAPHPRNLTCRALKPPAGWLGGISRKLASLMFGPVNTTNATETRVVKVVASLESNLWYVYVLAGHSLQRWELVPGTEKLCFVWDVHRPIRDAFHDALLPSATDTPADTDAWLLDLHIVSPGRLVLLAAAVNMQKSPQMHYAIASLSATNNDTQAILDSFQLVKIPSALYREDAEYEVLCYRLCGSGHSFNNRSITTLDDSSDTVDLPTDDRILGGGVTAGLPIFLTKLHGLVALVQPDLGPFDHLNTSVISEGPATPSNLSISETINAGNLTLYDLDPNEMFATQTEPVGQLKAAFIYHIKKNDHMCSKILSDAFSNITSGGVDAPLDKAIITVSRDLVNDIPAGDPRWADRKAQTASLGSSASVQILQQLQDKQRALNLFIGFLKETGLWKQLSQVTTSRGRVTYTTFMLAEHAEKIVAAISIKNLHDVYDSIIENGMQECLDEEGLDWQATGGLTAQDLFYRSVTRVHHLPQRLVKIVTDQTHSELAPPVVAKLIEDVNSIILQILQNVISFRQENAAVYACPYRGEGDAMISSGCEYVPWTSMSGTRGLRDSLMTLQAATLQHGTRAVTSDRQLTDTLYEQLFNLTDILLDGRKCQLESLRGTSEFDSMLQQYESERHTLIYPFVEDKQLERATALAEKYCDFEILIDICDKTSDQTRLDMYMERFSNQGFAELVFEWYKRKQQTGKLVLKGSRHAALNRLVAASPGLAWVKHLHSGSYIPASEALYQLSKVETEYVNKKKTMLSLSKLAQLASADTNKRLVKEIDNELELIALQEDLSDVVLTENGYNADAPRVIPAAELAELYISSENESATELDFKRALELTNRITDELQKAELQHRVWITALLRDAHSVWSIPPSTSAVETALNTTFFKLIDLAIFMGCSLQEFLPPLERILESSELGSLKDDANFQYLMKAGYEHIYETYAYKQ